MVSRLNRRRTGGTRWAELCHKATFINSLSRGRRNVELEYFAIAS